MLNIFSILNQDETLLVFTLITLFGIVLIATIKSKNRLTLFSPMIFISFIYLIYTLIGPLIFLHNDLNIFPERFIRPFFAEAWRGSVVSLSCIMIAYYLPSPAFMFTTRPWITIRPVKLFLLGLLLTLSGLTLYGLANPARFLAQLNPLAVEKYGISDETSGVSNYLSSSINFVIPGLSIMLLSLKRNIFSLRSILFVILFLVSLFLFISIGFRYRILMLIVSLATSFYIYRQKRPSMVLLISGLVAGILFLGALGETRKYGSGIQLDKLSDKQSEDLLIDGFRDANIFPVSGAVMRAVPEQVEFVGWDIIWNAVLFPVPRTLLPNKDTDSYIRDPIKAYKPLRRIEAHKWAAMLFFAEWYTAFGWLGIICISLCIGMVYKQLWVWVNRSLTNPFIVVIYALMLSMVYILISRGYLPFIVMSFFFIVFPAILARMLYMISFTTLKN